MTEADLIVRDRANSLLHPGAHDTGWWEAKCKHCGQVITKHDFTRAICVEIALASKHACKAPGQRGLF